MTIFEPLYSNTGFNESFNNYSTTVHEIARPLHSSRTSLYFVAKFLAMTALPRHAFKTVASVRSYMVHFLYTAAITNSQIRKLVSPVFSANCLYSLDASKVAEVDINCDSYPGRLPQLTWDSTVLSSVLSFGVMLLGSSSVRSTR